MTRQQIGPRIVLGAFAVALALPGHRVAAEVEGPFDYPSAEHFKGECEDGGGIFTDTQDGNLWCQVNDSQTVCSSEGDDCYDILYIPPTRDPRRPTGALGIEPTMNGGEAVAPAEAGGGVTFPIPGVNRASLPGARPHLVAPTPDLDQDDTTSKQSKHGKKHGHRGKHHKR